MASELLFNDLRSSSQSPARPLHHKHKHDGEVELKVKIVKNVTFKVKASDRIENIKAFIKQKAEEPVPDEFEELVTSRGTLLVDGTKLSDYFPEDIPNVNLVSQERRIKLTAKRWTNDGVRSTVLNVMRNDTVEEVKALIDCLEGTRSDEYTLIFKGGRLNDDITVEAANIKDGSVMFLVPCRMDTLLLQVVMPCGAIEIFGVGWLLTIYDLKALVQKNLKMPIDRWHLAYSGKALQDNAMVVSCGLEPGSVLHVVLTSVQIFVRIRSGKQITLFIKQMDDVVSLKEQIFKKTRYPVEYQLPIFSGRVLKEGRNIFTYGIQNHSTVDLRLRSVAPARTEFQRPKAVNRANGK